MKQAIGRFTQRLKTEREELWRVIEVVRLGFGRLWQSNLPRMAAALSYRTIFSLVPVLVVGVVVIGSFASEEQLRDQVQRLIEFAGLDTIAVDEGGVEPVGTDSVETDSVEADLVGGGDALGDGDDRAGGGAARTGDEGAGEGVGGGLPDSEAKQRLDEWITDLVTRVSGLPFGALGVVGVTFLVYAALSMLIELERAFNQIYQAPRSRNIVQMVMTYWTALTLGVVFLLGTFYAGDAVADWATSFGSDGGGENGEPTGGWISRNVLEVAINLAINTGLLLLAYTTVTNTRVRFRPAFAGAAIAGIAWELGKWGLTFYVKNFTGGLEQLYGAIALIPLFLLWVYVTWMIVLFGLQVSHAVQTFSVWSARDDDEDGPRLADPGLVLVVAVAVARRFAKGRAAAVDDVARELSAEEPVVRLLLDRLVEGGVVHRVQEGRESGGYVLARPADSISAAEVLRAGEALAGAGGAEPGLLGELGRVRIGAMGERTLSDVVQGGLGDGDAQKARDSGG
ncbi:MAG: YhjD/YihY/BrkB family envelope integrity protein [Planctomycetota bacterium]